jgi:mono/diheme cytochrome c family protein
MAHSGAWILGGGGVVAAVAVAAFAAIAWRPQIAPISPPASNSFSPEVVENGSVLAAVGDCAVCHTAAHGRPFAGGRPIQTPFGTIYATNITPDVDTGIGAWSELAFRRAMRQGIDRAGRHLYPVLPYPHFTHATDEDIAGMYAFLMTRAPVRAEAPPNTVPFPLNVRATIAGWNLLFLRPDVWRADPSQTAEWNRGSYLVDAVGHCGACHTPHNALEAEKDTKPFAGGEAEGWDAPALQAASPAVAPWTVEALTAYLRTGLSTEHGAAAGPMAAVTQELAAVPEADVRAIAIYFASMMPHPPPMAPAQAAMVSDNPTFAGACEGCHGMDAPMMRGGAPSLALSSAVNAPSSRDTIQVILHGLPWREGHAGPYMPGFDSVLSDPQMIDVVRYLRTHFSNGPPWTDIESQLRDARRDGGA